MRWWVAIVVTVMTAGAGPSVAAAGVQAAWCVRPPVAGVVRSGFGGRVHPVVRQRRHHAGIDIAAPLGSAVVAARAGVVRFVGWRRGYGHTVELDHGFGWESRYAHLRAAVVRRGAVVGAGALIGRVGATGLVTGPHLHFELHYAGQPLDPLPFLLAGFRGNSRFDGLVSARLK